MNRRLPDCTSRLLEMDKTHSKMQAAGSGRFTRAFGAGVFGALVMSVLMAGLRAAGYSSVNLELALGMFLTGRAGVEAWSAGLIWHLLNGGLFALIYAFGFSILRKAGAAIGAFFGFIQWAVVGYLLSIFPIWKVPTFFQIVPWTSRGPVSSGGTTILSIFALHVLFGLIVGAACASKFRETWREQAPLSGGAGNTIHTENHRDVA